MKKTVVFSALFFLGSCGETVVQPRPLQLQIIWSDVLGEEMRKGHADYVGRAETEQKRQQRLNTTHAGSLTGASPSENKEFRLGILEAHSALAICDSFN